jgi:hypothetical protein
MNPTMTSSILRRFLSQKWFFYYKARDCTNYGFFYVISSSTKKLNLKLSHLYV